MPKFEFRGKNYNNPVELALEVIAGRWKMPILWRLKDRKWRYSELKKSIGKVTHKMLSEQLKEMERDGLIKRKSFPVVPPRVEYSLTKKGKSVIPIINKLREWGIKFRNEFKD